MHAWSGDLHMCIGHVDKLLQRDIRIFSSYHNIIIFTDFAARLYADYLLKSEELKNTKI